MDEKKNDTVEVVELLRSYKTYRRMLRAKRYSKQCFSHYCDTSEWSEGKCEKRLKLIKRLILSLAPSDYTTLLLLYYVDGLPMEKCAECMGMSRASGFRLLKRAHVAIDKKYQRMKDEYNANDRKRISMEEIIKWR